MPDKTLKKSIFTKLRNNFIAGIVVFIPIGITLYLTLFIIKFSGNIIPKEINPNNYLPFDIPGLEILIAVIINTFIGLKPQIFFFIKIRKSIGLHTCFCG